MAGAMIIFHKGAPQMFTRLGYLRESDDICRRNEIEERKMKILEKILTLKIRI